MLTPSTRIAAEAAARHKFFHATATVASQVLRWELERSVRRGTREGGRLALKPVKKSRSKSPRDPSFMILCLVPWLRLSAVEPQHFGKPDLGHLVLQPGMWTKQVLRKPDMWRFAPITVAGSLPYPWPSAMNCCGCLRLCDWRYHIMVRGHPQQAHAPRLAVV